MTKQVLSLGLIFLFLGLFATFSEAGAVYDVYRLVQFDIGSQQFGSRRTTTDHLAATTSVKSEKLSKYIIVAHLIEFKQNPNLLQDLLARHVSGLLVILPEANQQPTQDWFDVEHQFLNTLVDIPVWMTYATPKILGLYKELESEQTFSENQASLFMADAFKLSVRVPEGSPIKQLESQNIQGSLKGSKGESVPTIVILSHYDSFGIVPELSVSADGSGSSTAALFELSRLFHLLNRKSTSREYNLVFLLTGAGYMNFTGATHWINHQDSRFLESVDFVLCLESIGTSEGLSLHVSRSPQKDQKAKKIYDTFASVASQLKIPFSVVQKKVNVSSTSVPWEHEHFSMKRLLAGTLSGSSRVSPPMDRSSLFDVNVSPSILARNVKFIAESLSRVIYDIPIDSTISVFEGNLGVSSDYLRSWMDTISSQSRMVPFLSSKDSQKTKLIYSFEKEFKRYLTDVSMTSFPVSTSYLFYDQVIAEMSSYRSKHIAFDILFSLIIVLSSTGLYLILKGPSQAIQQFQSLFAGSKKR